MIGFIKYKLFKWLMYNICSKGDCSHCKLNCGNEFGNCEGYDRIVVDCGDVHEILLAEARKVWKIE